MFNLEKHIFSVKETYTNCSLTIFIRLLGVLLATGSLEIGIEKALMAERLIDKMKFQVTSFEYIKKSTGELRRAWGTLSENLISEKVKGCKRKTNPNCICYYDIERGNFRSFLVSNLQKVY